MSELFLENPKKFWDILCTEEKRGNLKLVLNTILDLKIEEIEIKPDIETMEKYQGICSEKYFYAIELNAVLKGGETLAIGILTIPQNRIFQNIYTYWSYYYEKYIYPRNIQMEEIIMNRLGIEKEEVDEDHKIIYLGIEDSNSNMLQEELEFHIIQPQRYFFRKQNLFPSFVYYLSRFENQNLIVVPHYS